ncbi:2-acyl-glycerophospho-ethanolamine acyltransferase [Shimia sp. SK013]|uniref:lysophospholipid acyltransferase family protein n=1 Tax=Shimia sp. SK013 TaxID=1389006 RepID=UPI0006B52C60|nr:lysophospholipid acyltransferase family protein [Shimia sp. SK013]KPA22573.1 2-acyl-glycerophospho-ethanolamine acyltransferase [Shimia sp. SK013]
MSTWEGPEGYLPHKPLNLGGWIRVILRGVPLGILVFGCLMLLLLVRMFEAPMYGLRRPWTPYITRFVCRAAFRILGIGFSSKGTPMTLRGAVVANHSSWLDIFTLNARKNVYFVSKAEVAKWPGIGWLARATGTVFINRDRREAAAQKRVFEDRLLAGHKLLFFPEGTSTDGQRVLPFKSTLFAAFFDARLHDEMHIQPVTVRYIAPKGEDARFYGWWGDMGFGPHLLVTLGARRQGHVVVVYHEELRVADFDSRKALAEAAEQKVRGALVSKA